MKSGQQLQFSFIPNKTKEMEHFATEVSKAVIQYVIAPVVSFWLMNRKRKRTRRKH